MSRNSVGNCTLKILHALSQEEREKKTLLIVNAKESVDSTSNLDGQISRIIIQKEVVLVNCSPKEEEMNELFHVKIHMRQAKVDCLFDLYTIG